MREIHPLCAARGVDAERTLGDTQRSRALVARARHRLEARGEIEQRSNERRSERHDGREKCGEFDVECVHAHWMRRVATSEQLHAMQVAQIGESAQSVEHVVRRE